MSAFNVVRFRVKPGYEQQFIDTHEHIQPAFKGFVGGHLIKTGERAFCMVGEWRDMASLVGARGEMIGVLDQLRDMLEDLGGNLGVTDPVSGESVLTLAAPSVKKNKKKSGAKRTKSTKKKSKGRKKTKTKTRTKKKKKK